MSDCIVCKTGIARTCHVCVGKVIVFERRRTAKLVFEELEAFGGTNTVLNSLKYQKIKAKFLEGKNELESI